MDALWIVLLAFAICLNAYQLRRANLSRQAYDRELDSARKAAKTALSIDAQQLLHDLTRNGASVIRIDVLNPADLLLRSPRG